MLLLSFSEKADDQSPATSTLLSFRIAVSEKMFGDLEKVGTSTSKVSEASEKANTSLGSGTQRISGCNH
jgi:hypothetical protein